MLSELILITSKQYNPIENMRLMNVTLLKTNFIRKNDKMESLRGVKKMDAQTNVTSTGQKIRTVDITVTAAMAALVFLGTYILKSRPSVVMYTWETA